jgi:hypothetical protein
MTRPGTLEQLRLAVEDEKNPRILNMLDLPMGHLSQDPPLLYRYAFNACINKFSEVPYRKFASHEVAWQETRGRVGFVMQELPADKLSWGTAATAATTTWTHMDDDGFAAVVVVKSGAKWWVVMKPRKNTTPHDPIGDLGSSKGYPHDWALPHSGKGVFDAEGVLLRAGSVL